MKQPKKPLKFLENIPPLQVIPMKKKIRKMKKSLVILQVRNYRFFYLELSINGLIKYNFSFLFFSAKFVPSPKEAPTRTSSSSSSFSDLYKKKYGSRKSMKSTTDSSTNSQSFTEKVTYPPRPSSPRSKYNNKRFMPTPKPFRPANFPRYYLLFWITHPTR